MRRERKRIGEVISISGATVVVSLEKFDSTTVAQDKIRWADYVLIEGDEFSTIGQVVSLSVRSSNALHALEGKVFAEVLQLVSFDKFSHQFFLGVKEYPTIGTLCFTVEETLVRLAFGSLSSDQCVTELSLNLGTMVDGGGVPLALTPEAMFGRHCAVVGTSGGGKSWSLGRLIEEVARHRSKAIVVDATGEFSTIGGPVIHAHIGKKLKEGDQSLEVSLPYFQLLESDLFAVFQPSGDVQAPKLRAAIRTLKLLAREPHIALNGNLMKANRNKLQFMEAYSRHASEIESSTTNFNIFKLADQLKFECVNEIRSATETDYWGGYNSYEESAVFPLISRVIDATTSPNLEPIFRPEGLHSLFDIIEWFMGNEEARILSLSLEYLSYLHRARELVTNALGRQLMSYARQGLLRQKPLLLIVDEAHQFLNIHLEDRARDYPFDSFASIAKEGRKYSLNICLATQRPRDIPESVMSQMGTMLVHRLTNDADRAIIERSCGQADNRTLQALPALAPGEAILLGIDIPIPIKIAMSKPSFPPLSRGPDYQNYWTKQASV